MTSTLRRRLTLLLLLLAVIPGADALAQRWQWARLGRGSDHDQVTRVTADSIGNSYVMGRFSGGISFGSTLLSGIGLWDTFVAKYDQQGNVLWAVAITGSGNDMPGDLAVDRAGNVYVAGSYSGNAIIAGRPMTPRGGSDAYLAKLSPAGVVLWVAAGGGTGDDHAAGVGVDPNGQTIIIAGTYRGTASFLTENLTSAGGADIFVAGYTPSGGLMWVRSAGGPNDDIAVGMGVDNFASAYVTGTYAATTTIGPYTLSAPDSDSGAVFVAKYDMAGIPRWALSLGAFARNAAPLSVEVDRDGNSFIAGSFSDSIGFGTASLVSAGGTDAFLARVNPFGGFRWAVSLGDTLDDYGLGVGADNAGNAFLTGALDNTGTLALDTTYTERMFLARFTDAGVMNWSDTSDGGRIERGLDVALDRIGNHFVGGQFLDTLLLGDARLVATGGRSDAFVAKLGPDATVATAVGDTMLCAGGTVNVSYTVGGAFYSGNAFQAQISDSTGSFVLPTIIGTRVSGTAGTILATIPSWLGSGTRYRIRVVSTNPSVEGDDNGRDLDVIAQPRPIITGEIDDTLCRGETTTLDAGEGFAAYRWSTGALTRTITVSTSGIYHVAVTTPQGCEGRSDTARIVVFDMPARPVITLVGTQLRTTAAYSMQWYLDGVAIPGATRERITPTASGSHTVTVANEAGCSTTSDPYVYTTTGVREEIAAAGLVIERLDGAIAIASRCAIRASLVDMAGRTVAVAQGTDRVVIELDGLASGAYLLRVAGCDGGEVVRKVAR